MGESKRPGRTKAQIEEELACCIADLLEVPYEHRKLLTAQDIRSLVEFDHNIHNAIDGSHQHWNLTMRTILDHRQKTHKIDRPQIRKTDRITAEQKAFQARMLAKSGQADAEQERPSKPKAKIRSRGFQRPKDGQKQKIPSRPFAKRIA